MDLILHIVEMQRVILLCTVSGRSEQGGEWGHPARGGEAAPELGAGLRPYPFPPLAGSTASRRLRWWVHVSPRSPSRSGETHVDSSPEELCGPVELSLTGQAGGTLLGADRPRDTDFVGGPRSSLLLGIRKGRACDVARVPALYVLLPIARDRGKPQEWSFLWRCLWFQVPS